MEITATENNIKIVDSWEIPSFGFKRILKRIKEQYSDTLKGWKSGTLQMCLEWATYNAFHRLKMDVSVF